MNHKFLTLNFAYYMDGKPTLLMHLFILKAILCELLVCLYRELSHASNSYQNRWSSWIISSLYRVWYEPGKTAFVNCTHTRVRACAHTHTVLGIIHKTNYIWRLSSYPESKHEIDESPLCLSKHWCADKPLRLWGYLYARLITLSNLPYQW